jgi:CheY-like chemotaxis protein
MIAEKVLFVDDEPHLLAGIERGLRQHFPVYTATGGSQGLQMLRQSGPFAVVVSDMRMPEMTGVQFLAQVRETYPDSVRMILSGQSDLSDTIAAVNEGNIFRFLSKPTDAGQLVTAVESAVAQYRLLAAEKVLLEQTLTGAVNMLVEILSMTMPAAHSRAVRAQRYVVALAQALNLREQWQWPLAAIVSQIGCVALSPGTLSKVEAGQELNDEEQSLYQSHPEIARKLLETIPRLEDVAAIVTAQSGPLALGALARDPQTWDVRSAGRILLRAALDFDRLVMARKSAKQAAAMLRDSGTELPVPVVDALGLLPIASAERIMRQARIKDLAPGMLLDEALMTRKGALLLPAGHEVTAALIARLRSLGAGHLKEPFRVLVPI